MEDIILMLCDLPSAKHVSEHILSLKEEKKLLIIGLLWSWWDARNKANVGEQRRSATEVITKARLVMVSAEADSGTVNSMRQGGERRGWVPPAEGTWKINIDAAYCANDLKGAWGFIVRDSEGQASMAGGGCLAVVKDALCAEAHACVAALEAAADSGMQNIVVETDSQVLVKALQTSELDRAMGGVLFREAKFLMETMFVSASTYMFLV
ncbi:hypothetical protein C2845_PM07G01170 [Panicum miliaceum]|uniref:RNase H type-1 domain-containing protein n=1 Tax=Panicum miliaceum TaxID=4540 RepID=A0A3L6SLV9_PANMI|nr:hypothetical protein C2845_PM07G01170 [Panicum miliaceum]